MNITTGTTFSSPYADGNPLWRVTHSLACDVWSAECLGEDFAGVVRYFSGAEIRRSLVRAENIKRYFSGAEIRRSLVRAENIKRHFKNEDDWWAAQEPGTVLHYHNSFGKYVRGVVTDHATLLPTALVGAWGRYDLPHFNSFGDVVEPYYVEKIKEGSDWAPPATCVFEHPEFSGPGGEWASIDPRGLDDLNVPPAPLSFEQEADARIMREWREARDAIGSDIPRTPREAQERLDALSRLR